MNDEQVPDDSFLASFPWWVVMTGRGRPADLAPDESLAGVPVARPGPDSGFLVLDADGSTCLAVFTDEDLAGRFVEASGFGRAIPAAVATPRAFVELAQYLPPVCQYVAFDPPSRVGARARWVMPLAEVLRAIDGVGA